MNRDILIENVEIERKHLENALNELVKSIGAIPIANKEIMPFGWRKSAKGRTVWRILEEIISQNLELKGKNLGFENVKPAESEVGVYDFKFIYKDGRESFVNIKSSVKDGKQSKDDISKATGLIDFYEYNTDNNLYIATFVIAFNDNMTITIERCIVCPVAWIPDIYVNPSNNGNMQSSMYKHLELAIKRTNKEFLIEFKKAFEIAKQKKKAKITVL